MSARLQKLFSLKPSDKLLLIQAWFMLGWYRAAMLLLPFKRLTAPLQHHKQPITLAPLSDPAQLEAAKQLGYLVAVAARYTPWKSLCLVQVLVVQRLLARRGVPGQFMLGVLKGDVTEDAPNGLAAHAWLQCADIIVSGGAGHEQYAVVSAFSWGTGNG